MAVEPRPGYSGYASGERTQTYNQTAFRHLLTIERRRAARSMRSVLLVLVTLRGLGATARFTAMTAAAVFRGLGESVRDVDFVGWFREGRVAGAVLPDGVPTISDETRRSMAERIKRAIARRLPADDSRRLRIRVVRLVSRDRGHHSDELDSRVRATEEKTPWQA